MMLSDFSVKHPIAAIVASLLLVIFGIIAYLHLPLREYPDVDPPVVSVETQYPGATANTVETQITEPLEDAISGIQGINLIQSSSKDGLSNINIEFNLERNIEYAVNDVRDRISRIVRDLPAEAEPPEIFKADPNNDAIMWLNLVSTKMDALQLTDYAERYIVDQIAILNGVARVVIGGEKRYAMRIWLDRKAMAGRGITVGDIETALRNSNVELPGGRVETQTRDLTVRVTRDYQTPEDFEKLVVYRGNAGHLVRLGEVARIELGAENPRTELRGNRINMVGLGIIKQSTANTLAVANTVKAAIKKIQTTLPAGTKIVQSYDTSLFIDAAIKEVYITLAVAMLLVVLVIYLFLGSFRSVLIPAITVPISLIASFIVLDILNYSLNLITLLAFVLAVGLVVDDAIIVLENNYRRIQLGEALLLAALRGTRQIGFAVVATTIVLLAVFLPIAVLPGNIGRVFTEFAVAIAAAVAFSGFVALTLSPVMCAYLLTPDNHANRFRERINACINKVTELYRRWLTRCLNHQVFMVLLFIVLALFSVLLYFLIPHEFEPAEDRGAFFISVRGPEGANFNYMRLQMHSVEDAMMHLVDRGEAIRALTTVPSGFGKNETQNNARGVVVMKPWDERKTSTQDAMLETQNKLSNLPGIKATVAMRQGLSGSTSVPVQFVIAGTDYEELAKWRDILLQAANNNPYLFNVDSDYKETKPQIVININRDRAAELGVSLLDIGRTLETLFGSRDVTTYIDNGEEYKVILEAEPEQKQSRQDLDNIYVRSSRTDKLIPLSNFVTIQETAAAASLNHFNRLRAITISGNLTPGYSLGQALEFFEQTVQQHLPETAKIDYKGASRDFKFASHTIYLIFLLALLVAYLVLSAQYGSFIHPFVIMLTVPLAITGALFGLYVTGTTLNIYSQIGMIMLVGLAAKNGILMVEFINQLRDQNVDFTQAIIDGCSLRLRPILMTAIATIFGAVPLIIATGAGANSRFAIGIVIFCGILFATILTLFIVPIFYALLAKGTKSRNYIAKKVEQLDQNTAFQQ